MEGTELRILVVLLPLWLVVSVAVAEYGDVILNRYAEKADMRPVVFPHWFHRMRFRCKVCHHELGFEMRAGFSFYIPLSNGFNTSRVIMACRVDLFRYRVAYKFCDDFPFQNIL